METIEKAIPARTHSHQPARWPKNFSARPRLQRAFDAWYRANEHRFFVKLEFIRRVDACTGDLTGCARLAARP
jgi:hypothetical protein